MILVIDASVALKWFFQSHPDEPHTEQALSILEGIINGQYHLHQPPHFFAEVAAVLTRKKELGAAQHDLIDLRNIEMETIENPACYTTAMELSKILNHHLFDTLYHATALFEEGATLVTAEQKYFEKSHHLKKITLLSELG